WLYVGRVLVRAITGLGGAMRTLAAGDLSATVPGTDRPDELGEMARSVVVFKESMERAESLATAQRAEAEDKERRRVAVEALVGDFAGTMDQVASSVSHSASAMKTNSEALTSSAEQTSTRSAEIATTGEQTSSNVQTAAAAAEELHASIEEIG